MATRHIEVANPLFRPKGFCRRRTREISMSGFLRENPFMMFNRRKRIIEMMAQFFEANYGNPSYGQRLRQVQPAIGKYDFAGKVIIRYEH